MFTSKDLLISIGISLAWYLFAPVLKEVIEEATAKNTRVYGLSENEQKFFIRDKGTLVDIQKN